MTTALPDEMSVPFGFPAPAENTMDSLNGHDARLIMDLVANLRMPAKVLEQYGISAAEFAQKARSPIFAAAYREADRVWKSDMNIEQRIRLKAAFLLEDSLVPLFNIIKQDGIGITAKLAAIEQLTKISTVANVPKEGKGGAEKHNITINIGAGAPPITVVAETTDGTATASI